MESYPLGETQQRAVHPCAANDGARPDFLPGNSEPAIKDNAGDRGKTAATLASRRRSWNQSERHAGFYDPAGRSLAQVLAAAPDVRTLYLTGSRPGGDFDGWSRWLAAGPPPAWRVAPHGHYLRDPERPVLRFLRPDERLLDVHRATTWGFGDGAGVAACDTALGHLRSVLTRAFRRHGVVMDTPAATGRECWLATIPAGVEWPVLPDVEQRLIRSTSGQGRIEAFGRERAPAIFQYDARFAYAGYCWELPGPLVAHDDVADVETFARGWYRVRARVPAGWDRLGLLGVSTDPSKRGGWSYPREPGVEFETWCDGSELHVARTAGWSIDVAERLAFGDGRPLDKWAKTFVALYLAAGDDELLAAALRACVLHAIGLFHGRGTDATRSCPTDDERGVPAGAKRLRVVGDRFEWEEEAPPPHPELSHPEWSAAIWARGRARLLTGRAGFGAPTGRPPPRVGALHVAPADLLGLYTDTIYTAAPMPWPDSGRVGALRLKAAREAPAATGSLALIRAALAAQEGV